MRLRTIILCAFAASCGGRVAHPVPLETALDGRLSCSHLAGEYENNMKRLEELTGESREKFNNNLGLLISSPLFLDFSSTIKRETEALVARNERLETLMAEKECPPAADARGEAAPVSAEEAAPALP